VCDAVEVECSFIDIHVKRHMTATFGTDGWWWMAKCHVSFISISGLIGVWSEVIADVRQGNCRGCGTMGGVVGVKCFSNVLRAAMLEGVVVMMSRSCCSYGGPSDCVDGGEA
jgi:uncharacterized membrane protein